MSDSGDQTLERFERTFQERIVGTSYLDLYSSEPDLPTVFAYFHEQLNIQFDFMNRKADAGNTHFNAANSKTLLALIREIEGARKAVARAGRELVMNPEYERILSGARSWLQGNGGGPIPDGVTPVDVDSYSPVFSLSDTSVSFADARVANLRLIGEGAFAKVHSYEDPHYGKRFARKKLKHGTEEREKQRFRQEFVLMKELSHPNILEVYQFSEADLSYTMEFCDATLERYVKDRNSQPSFGRGTRKRIALQFLYALNYIHGKEHKHRDLSIRNVLIRTYERPAVQVKLSDFGLAKVRGSEFTRLDSEIKGSKIDPSLDSFIAFDVVHDIYAAGFVLLYIFTGRRHQSEPASNEVERIVEKCIQSQPSRRYQSVAELIADVDKI